MGSPRVPAASLVGAANGNGARHQAVDCTEARGSTIASKQTSRKALAQARPLRVSSTRSSQLQGQTPGRADAGSVRKTPLCQNSCVGRQGVCKRRTLSPAWTFSSRTPVLHEPPDDWCAVKF